MADASPLSLSAGDRVVYPNQGVCRVTGIEEKEVAGQKLVFVTMQREEDGARVMVPRPKLQSIGVRKISTAEDVEKMFAFLRAETEKADLDWKVRARTNVERMSVGGLHGLAEVVKGLQILSELRPLPTKERELYDSARHLLVGEISAALGMAECNAEDAVDVALFPPGRERPKRTAEEFKRVGEDEDMELGDEVLGFDTEVPLDETPEPEPEEAPAEEAEAEEAEVEVEEAPRKKAAPAAAEEAAPKRKRGRPAKPKPAEAEAAAPKKRGRPPKPKPAAAEVAAPKKRGRPPKATSEKATTKPAAKKKK